MTMWDRERPASDRRLRAQPGTSPPPEVKDPHWLLSLLVLLAAIALIACALLMSLSSR